MVLHFAKLLGKYFTIDGYVGLCLLGIFYSALRFDRVGVVESDKPDYSGAASQSPEQVPEISLWDRLGNACALDVEASDVSWDNLFSLHHTKYTSSNECSEDEMNKALEVSHYVVA